MIVDAMPVRRHCAKPRYFFRPSYQACTALDSTPGTMEIHIACRAGLRHIHAGWRGVLLMISLLVVTSACSRDATGPRPVDSQTPEDETPIPEEPEEPVAPTEEELIAMKIALFRALTDVVSGDGAGTTCISEGKGDWSGRSNPSGWVIAGLRNEASNFRIISECNVALTGTSASGENARVIHLERLEAGSDRVEAVMLYRLSATESVSFGCTIKGDGVNWTAEACAPDSQSDAAGIRAAAYFKLWELSGPNVSSYQYCLTEREGDRVSDPSAEVILRLMMQSTPRSFVAGSTCRHDGVNYQTSEGRVARLLHLDQVDEASSEAFVSGSAQWAWYANHLDCGLVKSGLTWSTDTCTPDLDAEVPVSQDAAIRIALFDKLLALEGASGPPTICLSEGEDWSDLQDPAADVVEGLSSSGRTFRPASDCSFALGGKPSAGGNPAQLFHIEWIRLTDMTANVSFQRNGSDAGGYLCNLGKVDGRWVPTCSPNLVHTQSSKAVAIYEALTRVGEFPAPEAYCVSAADAVPMDPSTNRVFRLSGTSGRFVPLSSCRWEEDVLYTASGEVAHQLHISTLDYAVYRAKPREEIVFACTTAQPVDVWTADCSRRPEPELTEDEIAARVAVYLYLASRNDHPDYDRNTVCVGESVERHGSYLRAEPAAVLEILRASNERFVDGSSCRLDGPQGAFSTATYRDSADNMARVFVITAASWQDGKATFDVTQAFVAADHHGFKCSVEKVDGVWKVTDVTGGWTT